MSNEDYIKKIIRESLNKTEKEILTEGAVLLPDDVMDRIKTAYDILMKNYDRIVQLVPPDTADPKILNIFKDFFEIQTLQNKKKLISFGIFNKDFGDTMRVAVHSPRISAVSINLAELTHYGAFESAIEHELIHAIDPKTQSYLIMASNNRRFDACMRAYRKNSDIVELADCVRKKHKADDELTDMDVHFNIYHKRAEEIDATMGPMIRTLKMNIKSGKLESILRQVGFEGPAKDVLFDFLYDVGRSQGDKNSLLQKVNNNEYPFIYLFFTRYDDIKKLNPDHAIADFDENLSILSNWSTRPTLYRKFLKYLHTELNK